MDMLIRSINRSLTAGVTFAMLAAGTVNGQSASSALRVTSPDGRNSALVERIGPGK